MFRYPSCGLAGPARPAAPRKPCWLFIEHPPPLAHAYGWTYTPTVGLLRKIISGTAASLTGGASLGIVQFRSDTERGTHQLKKLRRDIANSSNPTQPFVIGGSASPSLSDSWTEAPVVDSLLSQGGTDALAATNLVPADVPENLSPGWKPHPSESGRDQFWNGRQWTSKVRLQNRDK